MRNMWCTTSLALTRKALSDRWALAALLWRAAGWRAAAFLALRAAEGLLPVLGMLATGLLVGAVPGAAGHGLSSPDGHRALLYLGAAGLAFAGAGALGAWGRHAGVRLGYRYVLAIREARARIALGPPGLGHLEDPQVAAELASLDEADRSGLHNEAIGTLGDLVMTRVSGAGAAVLLLGLAWWAPLVLIAGWVAVDRAFARWVGRAQAGFAEGARGPLRFAGYLRGLAVEPAYAKEVRVFGLGGWVVQRFADTWAAAMAAVWRDRGTATRVVLYGAAALAAAHAVVLAFLGVAASHGRIGPDAVAVYAQAVLGLAALGPNGPFMSFVPRAGAHARQLLALEDQVRPIPRPSTGTGADLTGAPAECVRLEGVRFAYPGQGRVVLDGLDLTIRAGQSLAIVGENGAGKSTLTRLLCGLYSPQAGRITVDGADLAAVDPAAWRGQLGVIFQDFIRYQLPLSDNVGLGRLPLLADRRALAAALRKAGGGGLPGLLPRGWETVLAPGYDGGADLSGGQWQKVALARAFLAVAGGARLLILDEPTASLDVRAEAELFERFTQLTAGLTVILVTHRLSSVRRADRIVVIEDGKVAEDGSHAQLMAEGGRYASMFRLQAERFREGAVRDA